MDYLKVESKKGVGTKVIIKKKFSTASQVNKMDKENLKREEYNYEQNSELLSLAKNGDNAAMNKLIELQTDSKGRENVRKKQLIGNELKSHMYILAISNMLFRGDGKSNILNYDFFSPEFDENFKKKLEARKIYSWPLF